MTGAAECGRGGDQHGRQGPDNVFVEQLWRSVKYEEVYLHAYASGTEAQRGLSYYFAFYNARRLHEALDYATPDEVYAGVRMSEAA